MFFAPDPCTLQVVTCPYEISIEQKITDAANEAGVDAETVVRIAFAESSFRCDAVHWNKNGTNDIGLFQINSIHKVPDTCRLDCDCNIKWAMEKMKKQGFRPWNASKKMWNK